VETYQHEVEFVNRVIGNVPGARNELYKRYYRLVIMKVSRMAKHDIDDLIQEAWLLVMKQLARYVGQCALSTFIGNTAEFSTWKQFGNKEKLQTKSLDTDFSHDGDDNEDLPSLEPWLSSTDWRQVKIPARVDFNRMLLSLIPRARVMFLLAYVYGCTAPEIGNHYGITPQRVRQLIRPDEASIRVSSWTTVKRLQMLL
jgi:RNA polymerase sigma factor (sigma-70 family)